MIFHWFAIVLFSQFGRILGQGEVVYDSEDAFLGPVIVVGGNAYRLNKDGVTASYSQATEICYQFGWQLVRINSESKNTLITYLLEAAEMEGPFWTSANSLEDDQTWQLPDGAPMLYFNWNEGQPDNEKGDEKCIQISNEGGWDDKSCEASVGFICEEQDSGEDTIA